MRHHRNALAASALALPLVFGAWPAQAADILETLRQSGQFSLLVRTIEQAGLAESLEGEGPFTVFAPTDRAFHQIPLGVFNELLKDENRDDLRALLEHHVVEGEELRAEQLRGQERRVTSLQGDDLTLDGTGGFVVLVPTGLTVARVGDQVFVERAVRAVSHPAITVSATGEDNGDQQQALRQQQQEQQQRPTQAQAQQPQQQQQQQQQQEQQQQTAAREAGRTQQRPDLQRQQAAAGGMMRQQQPAAGTPGELEQLEQRYAMMREVPLRELQQAVQDARQALHQQNDWLADLNLERAELALRRSELDERREISRLLDEADRSLQQDDWDGARQALRQIRGIAAQDGQRAQLRRSLQEARAALGQGDRQWAGRTLEQADQGMAAAQEAHGSDGQQQQQQQAQRQRMPIQEQQGLFRAAMVVQPDIEADNGVIHAINQILVPQELEQQLAEILRPQELEDRQPGQQQQQQQPQQRGGGDDEDGDEENQG